MRRTCGRSAEFSTRVENFKNLGLFGEACLGIRAQKMTHRYLRAHWTIGMSVERRATITASQVPNLTVINASTLLRTLNTESRHQNISSIMYVIDHIYHRCRRVLRFIMSFTRVVSLTVQKLTGKEKVI